MISFVLKSAPFDAPNMESQACGAFATFEGRVRNEHGGKAVLALEYEAHPELAQAEAHKLLTEACARFGLMDAAAIHRTGRLELGETAIWVGVLAPHRREAFDALIWIMDEFKQRVPIWKKEHYADGSAGWVGIDDAPSAKEKQA